MAVKVIDLDALLQQGVEVRYAGETWRIPADIPIPTLQGFQEAFKAFVEAKAGEREAALQALVEALRMIVFLGNGQEKAERFNPGPLAAAKFAEAVVEAVLLGLKEAKDAGGDAAA